MHTVKIASTPFIAKATKLHHRDEIPICSFCDYQACTRFDKFHKQWCDSCYEHVYEDTATKTFTWNVLPCAECGERACKWRCVECEDVYCTKCFAKYIELVIVLFTQMFHSLLYCKNGKSKASCREKPKGS